MATLKQKKAAKEIVENGRTSISAVMREVGYSPATAVEPGKLTESKGWAELMEQYLPDDKLLKTHTDALEATKVEKSYTEPDQVVPDHTTRLKATELAYKIKRRLPREGSSIDANTVNFNQFLSQEREKFNIEELNESK